MFTPPSVNQIASAYQGNPQPLAQKVDADKKQHGGIPSDLRQLLALNDITQGRNAAGAQQALQAPTNIPTVAQTLQDRVRQMMQTRPMMQAMAPQQQGLNALPTNVGEQYAHGGIIGYSGTGSSQFVKDISRLPEAFDEWKQRARDEDAAQAEQDRRMEKYRQDKLAAQQKTSLFNYLFGTPEAEKEGQAKLAELSNAPVVAAAKPQAAPDAETQKLMNLAASRAETGQNTNPALQPGAVAPAPAKVNQPAAPRVNVDNAPMPGGLKDLVPAPDTEALSLLKRDMRRDPEAEAAALRARYMKEVGARDLTPYDRAMQELEARKERLNAPKTGIDSVMDLLANIAQSKGRTWQAAGSEGALNQKRAQLARQAQQDELVDKILELGAKKSEAEYGEKKGMFEMTQKEREEVYKKAYEAAKSVNASDDKAKELAQQAVLEREKMKNQLRAASIGAHDNLMSRAQALMGQDKSLTLEQAMRKAAEIAATGQMESADVRRQQNLEKGIVEIDKGFPLLQALSLNPQNPAYIKMKAERDQKVREYMARQGAGGQGIDTLPTALPAGVTVTKVK